MQKLFDSHAHYTDPRFTREYPGGADALLMKIMADGVGYIINVSTNLDDAERVCEMAKKYPGMYTAAGIHPEDIRDEMSLDNELRRLRELLHRARENKIAAVGEIGYDYHRPPVNKPRQTEFLERQLDMAEEFSLPVIFHDRDAHGDSLDIVRRHPRVHGVFHSFSGSAEMALELVRMGWYVSFSGVLTFTNARKTADAAARVPLGRILIETDCPYLAPHPHRGELNHSALMINTAERLAEIKGISTDAAVRATADNASRLFGIKIV